MAKSSKDNKSPKTGTRIDLGKHIQEKGIGQVKNKPATRAVPADELPNKPKPKK